MPTLNDLLKNFHDELSKLTMSTLMKGFQILKQWSLDVVKITICETDIVHGFLFTKDQGQKAKEPNIREVKYWKGDQPKLMQSNNGEKLIIYLPRLWKTLGQVCKICIVHPDFQSKT